MERDQEVQGQVTQMRFSLTLMLHQMEVNTTAHKQTNQQHMLKLVCFSSYKVTLQESFSKLLEGGGEGVEKEEGEDGEVRNLKLSLAQLRKKLKQTEDTHQTELQESKVCMQALSNVYNVM